MTEHPITDEIRVAADDAVSQLPCKSRFERDRWRMVTRVALEAAAPHVAAAERKRIYDELGHDHYAIVAEDRWTIEHSVECRLSGHMHECDYHEAIARIAAEFDPDTAGRWRIDGIDSAGLPNLVRADLLGDQQ